MSAGKQERDPTVGGLLRLLDVVADDAPGRFLGLRKPGGEGRVYGGQVIGQSLMAATKTVGEDRLVHSLHCYFMRPASEDYEIDYVVESDMDGGAFSNRRVVAIQQGKPIFNMIASFHRREEGFHHQARMPAATPADALGSFENMVRNADPERLPGMMRVLAEKFRPLDIRPVRLDEEAGALPRAMNWFRVGEGPIGVEQRVQRAILALASDALLMGTAMQPHLKGETRPNLQVASIDHGLWFHDDVECGEWLLYVTESPWSGNARGFSTGRIFSADGRLVASVVQEGLMRPAKKG